MLIDLNLLKVFLVLWDERSVTKAADRLHITQPGMSHILKRMRQELNDPLFTRGPHGLEPTAYAVEIEPRLRVALNRIPTALERGEFDPSRTQRHFSIAAGAYMCDVLVPRVLTRILEEAPAIRVSWVKIGPGLLDQLESATVDLAVGCFDRWPQTVDEERLFTEEMVWVARRGNPLGDRITDEALLAAPRLDVSIVELDERAMAQSARGMLLPRTGLSPEGQSGQAEQAPLHASLPRAVVYDSRTAMEIIAHSDLVGILPRRLVEQRADVLGLQVIARPRRKIELDISLLWSKSQADTSAHRWLRELIHRCV